MRGHRGVGPGDRGAGTILVIGLVAGVTGIAFLLAPVTAIAAARHRAGAAADSAAIAAAASAAGFVTGFDPDPCTAAAAIAAAHRAVVARCAVDGLVVTVRVEAPSLLGPVSASATAGSMP